jgi:hypothetical protein
VKPFEQAFWTEEIDDIRLCRGLYPVALWMENYNAAWVRGYGPKHLWERWYMKWWGDKCKVTSRSASKYNQTRFVWV